MLNRNYNLRNIWGLFSKQDNYDVFSNHTAFTISGEHRWPEYCDGHPMPIQIQNVTPNVTLRSRDVT